MPDHTSYSTIKNNTMMLKRRKKTVKTPPRHISLEQYVQPTARPGTDKLNLQQARYKQKIQTV